MSRVNRTFTLTVRRQMKTMTKMEAPEVSERPEQMVKSRLTLNLVERLHRRLLDVIKDEFERRGRDDVNGVQALLLYNIGDKELTASELRTRGYISARTYPTTSRSWSRWAISTTPAPAWTVVRCASA